MPQQVDLTKNHLLHGDCLLLSKMIPDQTIDLILDDPPFPGKTENFSSRMDSLDMIECVSLDLYLSWWDRVCQEKARILKKKGWFIFKSDDFTSKLIYQITQKYFDYYGDIVWDKIAISMGYSIRKRHELLCFYRLKNHTHYFKKPCNIPSLLNETDIVRLLKIQKGIWGIDPIHINQTPTLLWAPIIDRFCPESGIIADFFMGSGSIPIAMRKLNSKRRYWGCEITNTDQNSYVDYAKAEFKKTTQIKITTQQTLF